MKHYNRENYRNRHNPYEAAAYGPRRKPPFRGPLRGARLGNFNQRGHSPDRRRDARAGRFNQRDRSPNRRSATGRRNFQRRCEEREQPGLNPRNLQSRNQNFVIDRRGGRDRDRNKEGEAVQRAWATVGQRVKDEERVKESYGEEYIAYESNCDSDGDAIETQEDFDSTKLNHYKGVTKEGLKFCLEKAVEYWNQPDSFRYQIQCPCEWVRKEVSCGCVNFCFLYFGEYLMRIFLLFRT